MKQFTVLHISDLHYTTDPSLDQRIVVTALLEDVSQRLDEGVSPDLIVFTGDLVRKGQEAQAFEKAQADLVDPLISACGIESTRFLIVPGNHDVDITAIEPFWESGATANLISQEATNNFVDKADFGQLTPRFANFESLQSRILSNPTTASLLWSTYRIPHDGATVGVACINSAWRATGKPNHDYGRLLIAERQVDLALSQIQDCDLRVLAAHHPFEWLQEWDQRSIKRLVLSRFHLVLLGHNHYPDPQMVSTLSGSSIVSNAGCLYQSREYFNGYTWIQYRPSEATCSVLLRQYFDPRRAFDEATGFIEKGRKDFALPRRPPGGSEEGAVPTVVDEIIPMVEEDAGRALLSSLAGSEAPNDLRRLFVEPPLATKAAHEIYGDDQGTPGADFVRLSEVLAGRENVLFVGKKESGKSTLLRWCALALLDEADEQRFSFPFYVPLKDLRASRDAIERAMRDYVHGRFTHGKVEALLRSGKCTVLLDDLSPGRGRLLDLVRRFIERFPTARYLIAVDEDILTALKVDGVVDLGLKYRRLYIHLFTRSKAKELARKWFVDTPESLDSLVEESVRKLRHINVPRTPFLLSMVYWIIETQRTFVPINHAALVERLVNGMLEKLHQTEGLVSAYDYRNKEHYLAHIARRMVERDEYILPRLELEKETLHYFEARGLQTSIGQFIDYFVDRGVLRAAGEMVAFKFQCFGQYFIAKAMIEDKAFEERILQDPAWLGYAAELDYLTGLQRNNRSLLTEMLSRLEGAEEACGVGVDLSLFEGVALGYSPLTPEKRQELLAVMRRERPDEREQERMLDAADERERRSEDQRVTHEQGTHPVERLIETLTCASRLVRNCELIDDLEFKRAAVRQVITSWARVVTVFALVGEDLAEESAKKETKLAGGELSARHERILQYVVRVGLPVAVQMAAYDALGSAKLQTVLKAGAEQVTAESGELVLQMLYVMLTMENGLTEGLPLVHALVRKCGKHRYSLEILFYRLHMMYMLSRLSAGEREGLEGVLGDVLGAMEKSGVRSRDGATRNKTLSEIKKRWLLFGSGSDKAGGA